MEKRTLKNVNNCVHNNIYSYVETSGGQSYFLYLNVVCFLTPVLIKHLFQVKTVVFLNWCIICAILLSLYAECHYVECHFSECRDAKARQKFKF